VKLLSLMTSISGSSGHSSSHSALRRSNPSAKPRRSIRGSSPKRNALPIWPRNGRPWRIRWRPPRLHPRLPRWPFAWSPVQWDGRLSGSVPGWCWPRCIIRSRPGRHQNSRLHSGRLASGPARMRASRPSPVSAPIRRQSELSQCDHSIQRDECAALCGRYRVSA
jgi:hypothetical protein